MANRLIVIMLITFSMSAFGISNSWFDVGQYEIRHKLAVQQTMKNSCNIKLLTHINKFNDNPTDPYYKWKVETWSARCKKEKEKEKDKLK